MAKDKEEKSTNLGGPTGGIKLSGVIAELSMSDLDEAGSVTVRHGPKPKKDKDGLTVGKFPKTTHLDLPKKQMENLKIGQKVDIRVVIPEGKVGGVVRV